MINYVFVHECTDAFTYYHHGQCTARQRHLRRCATGWLFGCTSIVCNLENLYWFIIFRRRKLFSSIPFLICARRIIHTISNMKWDEGYYVTWQIKWMTQLDRLWLSQLTAIPNQHLLPWHIDLNAPFAPTLMPQDVQQDCFNAGGFNVWN